MEGSYTRSGSQEEPRVTNHGHFGTDFTEPLIQSKKKSGKTNKIHFLLFGQIKNMLACCIPLKLRLVSVLSQLCETVETSQRKQARACARPSGLISAKYTIKGTEKKKHVFNEGTLKVFFSPSVHIYRRKFHLENRCCSRISLLATPDPSLFR